MAKKKSRVRLTKKQQKLIKEIQKEPGASLTELGLRAGYSGKTPRQKAYRALKSKPVQQTLREAMEADPGLCRKVRLEKLKEGMAAERTQFFASDGRVIDERTTIDFPTRKSYLELADRLCGDLTSEQVIKFDGPMPFKMVYTDEAGKGGDDKTPQIPKQGDKSKP